MDGFGFFGWTSFGLVGLLGLSVGMLLFLFVLVTLVGVVALLLGFIQILFSLRVGNWSHCRCTGHLNPLFLRIPEHESLTFSQKERHGTISLK